MKTYKVLLIFKKGLQVEYTIDASSAALAKDKAQRLAQYEGFVNRVDRVKCEEAK